MTTVKMAMQVRDRLLEARAEYFRANTKLIKMPRMDEFIQITKLIKMPRMDEFIQILLDKFEEKSK